MTTAMKREEELTVSVKPLTWEHDGSRYHAYCRITDTRYVANNEGEKREREAGRAARIRSALVATTKPETTEGVDRQVHPSKPVVSQNTQTVEDNGGADYLPDDIESYFRRQIWWSENTFGPALRTKGVIDHIRKELTEIEREPHDLSEWIDVVILAMDGFWRHGGNASDLLPALLAKQRKNMAPVRPDARHERR